jgi:hypothetical protein
LRRWPTSATVLAVGIGKPLDAGHGAQRVVARVPATVQPRARARQQIDTVAQEIVGRLAGIGNHQPPALGGKRRLQMLDAESGQAVAMLDQDRGDGGVGEHAGELGSLAVHASADLADHPAHNHAPPGGPQHDPGDFPVQVGPLVVGGDPCVHHGASAWHAAGRVDQDRARGQASRGTGMVPWRNGR